MEQYSIPLTEQPVVQEIVRLFLTAASGDCTTIRPDPQSLPYGVDLILYKRLDVDPRSPASVSAMLAHIYYSPEGDYISLCRPGLPLQEFCPVKSSLREILRREFRNR
ncbi:MAG: hypothetical protein RMK30_05575 [Anaerolineae bacterium]|nr:hypothetical protein [Anaerolineae bacterium]